MIENGKSPAEIPLASDEACMIFRSEGVELHVPSFASLDSTVPVHVVIAAAFTARVTQDIPWVDDLLAWYQTQVQQAKASRTVN